ncbi:alpha-galactosidase [Aggregatimonas sangjinii]|uniref:Alpha-galactosidase n=2 Tax=Aggregatimonas sangjinii TaxID=2583587 RepID=A0A5B7SUY2_9FLAO|nr:alpha-galactosidase [Aggregatimonas sangjinii]
MTPMQTTTISEIFIDTPQSGLHPELNEIYRRDGLVLYDFKIASDGTSFLDPVTLRFKLPGTNVKGIWKPTADFSKRIQADWELNHMESRISIDAPVISLFGNKDENILTFSCSNAINTVEMNARLREEDNCFYCHITFFSETEQAIDYFKVQLRLDYRNIHFSKCLRDTASWWEGFPQLKPAFVPAIAKKALYSTWYQFHQNLNLEELLEECRLAYGMGYEVLIIDDGWQTSDGNRGYDFTGDWQPERFPDVHDFVKQLHKTGMKVAFWYSVPFCGKKSKAYQKFRGKFLTENHRWAPVFDPRYPEVREYLLGLYTSALKDWGLDGFKLDFIDDFHLYEDTPLGARDGRDYASINEAVDRLLTDVKNRLTAINPEVFIEFRQKYTGPAMRKYGNMFRAFDCPGDAVMNRVRIADIKMLCGNTAVHSDMVTWHNEETTEVAALQMINILFGVPQLSIFLAKAPTEHLEMVEFYTRYWNEYADVLLHGTYQPSAPLANYPTQRVTMNGTTIIGVYQAMVTDIDSPDAHIHIHNGQLAEQLVLRNNSDFGAYNCTVFDCRGTVVLKERVDFNRGLLEIAVPPCGILIAEKESS